MNMTTIAEFSIPSQLNTERLLVEKVVRAVGARLQGEARERMKTAVAEAVMNAIEHGNQAQSDLAVGVQVLASDRSVVVRVTDHGSSQPIPETTSPDIEAMLAGQSRPRGWGLFLIRSMADEMQVINGMDFHMIEMVFNMESPGNEHKIA